MPASKVKLISKDFENGFNAAKHIISFRLELALRNSTLSEVEKNLLSLLIKDIEKTQTPKYTR